MKKIAAAMLPLLLALAGCATYHPHPLPTAPALLQRIPQVVPGRAPHPFNPADGLDMTEVAILAVANNPDLRSARDQRGVAASQLMAAGILPNPQLTAGLDHPFGAGPGYVNAFNLGLNYNVGALVTRSAAVAAARSASRKVDWSLLWQEWQVVQKARLLFIRRVEDEKVRLELQGYRDLLADRYRRANRAMEQGNLTINAVSANLAELQKVRGRLAELERRQSRTGHDLNALLGLAPDVPLSLTGGEELPALTDGVAKELLAQLPHRRPDLLALQAGYESQEEQLRRAVLAQFPALNIGLTRARDTSDINTYGFGVSLTLPIFDRNQGAIAVARATRRQLYDEYQARLDDAYSKAGSLLEQIALVRRQYREVAAALPPLEKVVGTAEAALAAGNMEFATFSSLRASLFEKRLEALALEQSLFEQQAILQTLLGADFRGLTSPPQIYPAPGEEKR
ncbi:TolC family protein [Geobacter sp.]|uniref:TolC family protein n=1 Tax=Geobacter sp. TaxID=46610 RepID=UPI00260E61A8|nr:TolC family protein [Geobacter sp.]